jgi:hypothetical protein
MSIITISHEAFGDGRQIAERVASILNYRCISREVLVKASERYGIAEAKLIEVLEERPHHWSHRRPYYERERPGFGIAGHQHAA